MLLKKRTIKVLVFLSLALGLGVAAYFYFNPARTRDVSETPPLKQESRPPEKVKPDDSPKSPVEQTAPIQPQVEREEIKKIKIEAEALMKKIDQKLLELGVDPSKLLKIDEKEKSRRQAEIDRLKQRLQNLKETEPEK